MICYWFDETFRIHGLIPRKPGAAYDAFLALIHPNDGQAVGEAVGRLLCYPDTACLLEYRIVLSHGGIRTAREPGKVLRVLFDADNNKPRLNSRIVSRYSRAQEGEKQIKGLKDRLETKDERLIRR